MPDHICSQTHFPKLADRGAALLQLPERAEQLVGLLWRGGPDAAGLTPCRHSSWNTPGLSVLTFFNLICIRPSLGPNRFGGRRAWKGGCGPKKNNSIRMAHHPLSALNICIHAVKDQIGIWHCASITTVKAHLVSHYCHQDFLEIKSWNHLACKQCVVILSYQRHQGAFVCMHTWVCLCIFACAQRFSEAPYVSVQIQIVLVCLCVRAVANHFIHLLLFGSSWLAANFIPCRLIKNVISYRVGLFLFIQRAPTVAILFNLHDVFQKQSGEIPLQF